MMFGYKIKAMCKGYIKAIRKRMRKMMFGYQIKAMHKVCVSYAQDDVWV